MLPIVISRPTGITGDTLIEIIDEGIVGGSDSKADYTIFEYSKPTQKTSKPTQSYNKKRNVVAGESLGFFICPATGINWGKYHGNNAVDIANVKNTDILASHKATVTTVGYGYNGGLGNFIVLQDGDIETLYAHLSVIYVKENQQVNQADIIGLMGSSGHCVPNGAIHLHWETHNADNPLN